MVTPFAKHVRQIEDINDGDNNIFNFSAGDCCDHNDSETPNFYLIAAVPKFPFHFEQSKLEKVVLSHDSLLKHSWEAPSYNHYKKLERMKVFFGGLFGFRNNHFRNQFWKLD